jgi:hypothetical protein
MNTNLGQAKDLIKLYEDNSATLSKGFVEEIFINLYCLKTLDTETEIMVNEFLVKSNLELFVNSKFLA